MQCEALRAVCRLVFVSSSLSHSRYLHLCFFLKSCEDGSPQKEVHEQEKDEEEENPRHSIFERVAASVRSLSFR